MGSCLSFIKKFFKKEKDQETDSLIEEIEPNYMEKEYEEIDHSPPSIAVL